MIIEPSKRLKEVKEYYFSKKLAEVREMISNGDKVINLGIGNPNLMPSPKVIETLRVSSGESDVHGYQPYKGIPELRQAIASWTMSTYGINLDAETNVLPLIGSKEGITHISMAFLDEGDQILIPDLSYPAYAAVAGLVKAEVATFPLIEEKGWEPDWDFLERLDCSKVKILWINYPHMPTGTPAKREIFEKFIDFARRKEVLICHDNPYSLILNQKEPLSILSIDGAMEVAIELNSMSKSHNMAGWRVGWVCGDQAYINTVLRVKSNVDSGMFRPIQLAAIEGLSEGREWSNRLNEVYRKRKLLVQKLFDVLGCTYSEDQEGLFVWAKVGEKFEGSSAKLADYLLYEHKVFVTPGFIFGEKGNSYARIALCSTEQDYKEAISRVIKH